MILKYWILKQIKPLLELSKHSTGQTLYFLVLQQNIENLKYTFERLLHIRLFLFFGQGYLHNCHLNSYCIYHKKAIPKMVPYDFHTSLAALLLQRHHQLYIVKIYLHSMYQGRKVSECLLKLGKKVYQFLG